MKINNHNYEMYFLLYADNELCLDEMKMVEDFVSINPELNKEFQLTLSSKISADDIFIENKINLFKFNSANLQETLLLHLDDEDVIKATELEKLINNDSEINKEWNILKVTKLDRNDELVFKNKSSLFKYENNIISFLNFRNIAAAILIGLGLFFGIKLFINNKVNPVPQFVNTNYNIKGKSEIDKTEQIVNDSKKSNPEVQVADNNLVVSLPNDVSDKEIKEKEATVQSNEKVVKEKEGNLFELNKSKETYNQTAIQKALVNVEETMLSDNSIEFDKIEAQRKIASLNNNKIEALPVKNISLAALNNNDKTESLGHVFIIDEEKVNNSKAGGFFKKVKKFVSKTTNIELPEHLFIGNYEIAIK